MATKEQLQRDLEQERQRALNLILRELSKRVGALNTQITEIKTAEQARLDLERQRILRRFVDGFLTADWKGKIAYLSPFFGLLILGYALAVGQSPAIVAADLLRTIGLCATGAPNNAHDPADESAPNPLQARPSGSSSPGPDHDGN